MNLFSRDDNTKIEGDFFDLKNKFIENMKELSDNDLKMFKIEIDKEEKRREKEKYPLIGKFFKSKEKEKYIYIKSFCFIYFDCLVLENRKNINFIDISNLLTEMEISKDFIEISKEDFIKFFDNFTDSYKDEREMVFDIINMED